MEKADLVVVTKKENTLILYKNKQIIGSYSVVFGSNPNGHKQQEGDKRTPEGFYTLDYKKQDSAFY
ncbi:MAG: L,D-transpeptidase family protein, partial [Sulfurospirillum sp.]|nr:L,D-transpeptidase family protein [Sulfurospirillum sp.]